jgi:exopolysaccharide production protein ExoQ
LTFTNPGIASSPLCAPAMSRAPKADVSGWLLCFISLLLLLLNVWSIYYSGITYLPVIDILLFLSPWIWIYLRNPAVATVNLLSNWFLLALPGLTLISPIWSDYPAASARSAIEYLVTAVIGILAGSCIRPRVFLSSLLCALGSVALLSVIANGINGQERLSGYAMEGVFASKNYFASTMAMFLLAGLAVTLDRNQLWPFRLLGLLATVTAPLLLKDAQSTGATAACVVAALTTFSVYCGIRLLPQFRAVLIAVVAVGLITFLVIASLNFDGVAEILDYFGKDITLTGRIFLWEHALRSISENPLFGVGFQGYWQLGNPGAEECWAYARVGKYGFNFHNTFLQVAVDVGLTGLALLVATFLAIGIRAVVAILRPRPKPESLFAMAVFIYFLLRTPIEVELFYPFQLPTILICVSWIYLRESSPTTVAPRRVVQLK